MPDLELNRIGPSRMRRIDQLLRPLHASIMIDADLGDDEYGLASANPPGSRRERGGMRGNKIPPADEGYVPRASKDDPTRVRFCQRSKPSLECSHTAGCYSLRSF